MTEFQREERYIVIKRSRIEQGASPEVKQIRENMIRAQIPENCLVDAVVVEAGWPEYERVWDILAAHRTDAAGGNLREGGAVKALFRPWTLLHRWKYRNPYDRTCRRCSRREVEYCRSLRDWNNGWWGVVEEGTPASCNRSLRSKTNDPSLSR